MIFQMVKSNPFNRIFRSIVKKDTFSNINNYTRSSTYWVVSEKQPPHLLQYLSVKEKIYNPFCIDKCFRSSESSEGSIDRLTFDSVCAETLDSLCEYFEELVESLPHLKNADVTYSDGVLTVQLGKNHGTYVINRQTPNLQIWLSSPKSGPKRYDFIDGTWIYKHDNTTLHSLLDREIKEIANKDVEFVGRCLHAKNKA